MHDSSTESTSRTRQRGFQTKSITSIIGYRLRRAQLHVFQQFISRFAQFDLRPAEYSVLVLIADNPGSKQTEIARALGIKRTNFVALISGLDARGFTERRRPAGDRRSHAIYLTPTGEVLMQSLNAAQAEFEAYCVAKLGGAKARDQFMGLLDRLLADEEETGATTRRSLLGESVGK